MRILLVHNHYRQRGGEDAVFEAELALLESAGHEVSAYEVSNDEFGASGRIGLFAQTVWNRRRAEELRAFARDRRIDVAHFHNTLPLISPAAYGAVRSAGAAVVQTIHNYRLACPSALLFRDGAVCEDCLGKVFAWPSVRHGCYRGSRPASAAVATMLLVHKVRGTYRNDVDAYITLTGFARAKLRAAGLPADRLPVLPNFLVDDPGFGDVRGRNGALFVGRLNPEKGVRILLQAFAAHAATDGPTLRIAGDGPLASEVEAAAAESPRIEWLGAIDRNAVLTEMRRAAFLVFPSTWYEGFPMTIVEAFASGLPVIASDIGSLGSIVDRAVGNRIPPGDAAALRRSSRCLQDDLERRAELGATARARFESEFSPGAHLKGLERIYETAVARRASRAIEAAGPQRRLRSSDTQRDPTSSSRKDESGVSGLQ